MWSQDLPLGRTYSLNYWEYYLGLQMYFRCLPMLQMALSEEIPGHNLIFFQGSQDGRQWLINVWVKLASCSILHLEVILKDNPSSIASHWSQQRPSLRLHCSLSFLLTNFASIHVLPGGFMPSVLPKNILSPSQLPCDFYLQIFLNTLAR